MAFDKGDTRPLIPLSAKPVPPEDSPGTYASEDSGQVPRAPRRRRGGCGCWLTGLFTLFLILVLVAVGLFLPPVQLIERLTGPQYFPINADAYAVQLEGLTLQVDPAAPGEDFSVAIDSLAANEFLAGAAGPEWLAGARSALPAQLAPAEPGLFALQRGHGATNPHPGCDPARGNRQRSALLPLWLGRHELGLSAIHAAGHRRPAHDSGAPAAAAGCIPGVAARATHCAGDRGGAAHA